MGARGLLSSPEIAWMDLSAYPDPSAEKLFLQDLFGALNAPGQILAFDEYEQCHPAFLQLLAQLSLEGSAPLDNRYVLQKGMLVAGVFVDRSGGKFLPDLGGMILGTALCYALGTAWFVYLMNCSLWYALTVCVFPFIAADLAKMVIAHLLGKTLRLSLRQAHLL